MEDTRQKELFYFQTLPSTGVDFFYKNFYLYPDPKSCVFLIRLRAIKKESTRTISVIGKCLFFSRSCRNYS